jgi:hypothetical protein
VGRGRDELRVGLDDGVVQEDIRPVVEEVVAPDDAGAAVLGVGALFGPAGGEVVDEGNFGRLDGGEFAGVNVGGFLIQVAGVVDDVDLRRAENVNAASAVVVDEIVFNERATAVGFERTVAILMVGLAWIRAAALEDIDDDAVAVGERAAVAAKSS